MNNKERPTDRLLKEINFLITRNINSILEFNCPRMRKKIVPINNIKGSTYQK